MKGKTPAKPRKRTPVFLMILVIFKSGNVFGNRILQWFHSCPFLRLSQSLPAVICLPKTENGTDRFFSG